MTINNKVPGIVLRRVSPSSAYTPEYIGRATHSMEVAFLLSHVDILGMCDVHVEQPGPAPSVHHGVKVVCESRGYMFHTYSLYASSSTHILAPTPPRKGAVHRRRKQVSDIHCYARTRSLPFAARASKHGNSKCTLILDNVFRALLSLRNWHASLQIGIIATSTVSYTWRNILLRILSRTLGGWYILVYLSLIHI